MYSLLPLALRCSLQQVLLLQKYEYSERWQAQPQAVGGVTYFELFFSFEYDKRYTFPE